MLSRLRRRSQQLPRFRARLARAQRRVALEYTLGSTLYLLFVGSQNPNVTVDPAGVPRLNLNDLRDAPASDVLMLRPAYWIG